MLNAIQVIRKRACHAKTQGTTLMKYQGLTAALMHGIPAQINSQGASFKLLTNTRTHTRMRAVYID
jgi:hypothetical protein